MSNTNHIRYVILNGPHSSGKSNIARELAGVFNSMPISGVPVQNAIIDSFAAPLKHFYASALGMKHAHLVTKNYPMPELNGYTLRECWVDLAEEYIKKRFGEDVFAKWLVFRSLRNPMHRPKYYIIDDGGFIPEIEYVPNRMVIAVSRPMTEWKNDTRSYYPKPDAMCHNAGNSLARLWHLAQTMAVEIEKHKWQ